MPEPAVGAVIVTHIEELEAAIRYAHSTMEPMLEKAVAALLDDKRRALGWAGEAPADFDKTQWFAPEEWRMPQSDENDCYLSFVLDTVSCIDGHEPETWVGTIAGFAGAGIRFSASTEALGQRDWKALLRSQGSLIDELIDRGFLFDPKTGDVALTIPVSREALVAGFEEEDLEAALEPLGLAIDRIHAARSPLDRLVEAIKAARKT
ncbi:hypothetical protein [Novosphingobium sp. TCA1]|uniref:hypothetical protein n=1 Tax=Novosphingobium sp. TCA1 TaxID=2682474 RepID=UPI00130BDD92|nr:hypothetical protein [Novosphingobium sp. TCA1]GFE76048.1 hypothetical protein NTCA1_36970 [Novosphingobium sp. TCA1]